MEKKDLNKKYKVELGAMNEEEFEKEIGLTNEKWHSIKNKLSEREENIRAKVNHKAPDFNANIVTSNGEISDKTISLSDFKGEILALVLGSYTCPVFRSHNNRINEIYDTYRDKASFLQVYVYEMHPANGWFIPINLQENVIYDQPKSDNERAAIAKDWIANKNIQMPVALDNMENTIDSLYAGSPERLYIIDKKGEIRFRSSEGPFENNQVEEWEQVLNKLLITELAN